jgi:hypothetical protein
LESADFAGAVEPGAGDDVSGHRGEGVGVLDGRLQAIRPEDQKAIARACELLSEIAGSWYGRLHPVPRYGFTVVV